MIMIMKIIASPSGFEPRTTGSGAWDRRGVVPETMRGRELEFIHDFISKPNFMVRELSLLTMP